MSIVRGGSAGFNSVVFYSDNFSSKAIRKKDGSIKTEITKRVHVHNLERLIKRIPIIRGLFLFAKPFIIMLKIYIIVFLPLLIFLWIKGPSESTHDSSLLLLLSRMADSILNYFWLLIAVVLAIYAVIIKRSNLGKYHGAEHMTDSSYDSLSSLMISDIVKQSRIHKHCGTNFVVFLLLTLLILSFFIKDVVILIVVSTCLGYEVFLIKSRIMLPFYCIGGFFQYILFTSKPSTKHLEVAVASYEALIGAETDCKKTKE